MTANERRKLICERLCVRRKDTRENLAAEFNVSTRTIERDIVTLSLMYPIYTVQGGNGGIYMAEWYKACEKHLTCEEAELLEELQSTLSVGKAEIIRGILKKFKLQRSE